MSNTISPYFTDEDLITQLTLLFDNPEVKHSMDYRTILHQVKDEGDVFSLRLRGKRILIDKVTGNCEVKQ